MAKKQKTTPSRGNTTKASAAKAPRRPERSIDMLTGSRDPAIIVKTLRDNWSSSLTHQRPLSMSRAYAELVKLLDGLRPDPAPYLGQAEVLCGPAPPALQPAASPQVLSAQLGAHGTPEQGIQRGSLPADLLHAARGVKA